MTLERRIIAGLEDVRAISLECNKCRARVTFSADSKVDVPVACERCGHPWRSANSVNAYKTNDSAVVSLVQAIPNIRILLNENALGFRVLFEFYEPK